MKARLLVIVTLIAVLLIACAPAQKAVEVATQPLAPEAHAKIMEAMDNALNDDQQGGGTVTVFEVHTEPQEPDIDAVSEVCTTGGNVEIGGHSVTYGYKDPDNTIHFSVGGAPYDANSTFKGWQGGVYVANNNGCLQVAGREF